MARTARTRTHYVLTAELRDDHRRVYAREYNVEERQGWGDRAVVRTIGRIVGGGSDWMALPVAASAWTLRHRTRAAALDALRRREDCVEVQRARWRTEAA